MWAARGPDVGRPEKKKRTGVQSVADMRLQQHAESCNVMNMTKRTQRRRRRLAQAYALDAATERINALSRAEQPTLPGIDDTDARAALVDRLAKADAAARPIDFDAERALQQRDIRKENGRRLDQPKGYALTTAKRRETYHTAWTKLRRSGGTCARCKRSIAPDEWAIRGTVRDASTPGVLGHVVRRVVLCKDHRELHPAPREFRQPVADAAVDPVGASTRDRYNRRTR